jgi:hypothetical protein
VDTDARRSSVARIADKSTASGNATRRQRTPSVDKSTTPARPTIQQTDDDGATPAARSTEFPVGTFSQRDPPFVECVTMDPVMRHRTAGSGETISIKVAFRPDTCA